MRLLPLTVFHEAKITEPLRFQHIGCRMFFNTFNSILYFPGFIHIALHSPLPRPPPNWWLVQRYASLTTFSIFPGFAIETERMLASGIAAARRSSRPNYGSTSVAGPAYFVCQAVWALS